MHMMHIACDAHLSAQCISLRMQIKQIITDEFTPYYCQQLTPCKKNRSLNKIFWGSQFLYSDDFWLIANYI